MSSLGDPVASATVLVIDDSAADIRMLSQMLRDEGYLIIAALQAEQGLKLAIDKQPDLILLDLHMPGVDGRATCRRLKSDPRLASIPVVFLTASNHLDDKLEGFALGAVDYITKPFSIKEVSARLRVQLKLHRQLGQAAPETAANAKATGEPDWISSGEALVRKAQARLLQDLSVNPSLTDLAHAVGTNERRLTDEFRRYTGFAVFEYLREERHRRACELLLHSESPINIIAERVGYQAVAAFTYAFRKRLGITPSEYRHSAGLGAAAPCDPPHD